MSATLSQSTSSPVLEGAVCTACHAPLGRTARYCLNCGERQAAARVELIDLVVASRPIGSASAAEAVTASVPVAPAGPGAAGPAVPAPAVPPASVALLPAPGPRTWPFAVTAVVLVALVVGLLVGRWLGEERGSAEPQVIRIEAPAAVPAASGGAE